MVMSSDEITDEPQVAAPDEDIVDLGDADVVPEEDAGTEAEAAVAVTETPPTPSPEPAVGESEPVGRQPGQAEEIEELQRHRKADQQREWEGKVARKARQIEKRLIESGQDQRVARQFAGDHVRHQKELRDQEGKAMDLIGFVEGRHNAALHFAHKHKLIPKQIIDDLQALSAARTPQEMEREARRMATMRHQSAEIARLKQGRVGPQTFDNSQGAAEATTNQDRLLDAYISGDRSEAAVKAARSMTFGS